jgi:hypothetical protein
MIKNNSNLNRILLSAVVGVILSLITLACSPAENPPRNTYKKPFTLLVYMVADNNLDSFAVDDINEMEEFGLTDNMDVVVYLDRVIGSVPESPVVLLISNDNTADVISPVVRSYEEQDSCASDSLRGFIEWAKSEYPSERYGIVLWSHGTGWLPDDYVPLNFASKKAKSYVNKPEPSEEIPSNLCPASSGYVPLSFGRDVSTGKSEMNIDSLSTALQNQNLDFVIFDACYMGDVEVAYQLRDVANYLLFSQIEILNTGFPYNDILPVINNQDDTQAMLEDVAVAFYNSYANSSYAYQQSASISLIDLGQMSELANSFSNFMANATSITNKQTIINLLLEVQKISLSGAYSNIKFDLKDWADKIYTLVSNSNSYELFDNSFAKTVVFQTNTPYFMDSLALSNIHGLNCYIPFTNNASLDNFYTNIEWFGLALFN